MQMDKDLFPMICNDETFFQAWKRVKANMGSPGIDRVSLEDFEAKLQENLSLLRELVWLGTYEPLPLLVKEIEKESDTKRVLRIPAIRDRIAQEAALHVLQPELDGNFLDCSYGYRPRKSASMAIRKIERAIRKGKEWIVDADIQDFYDTVNQGLLINLFTERVSDPRIVKLVKGWIGFPSENGIGIPQGAVISPLLANIYLHRLDAEMVKGPGHYVRYCDDFVALCESRDEAQRTLEAAQKCLEEELFLRVNREKTRICHLGEGFNFLGFQFTSEGKKPSARAIKRLKTKIDNELEISGGVCNVDLSSRIKTIIRGWQNYFHLETSEREGLLREINNIIKAHNESIPAHMLRAALYIDSGEKEMAREIINEKIDLPSEDGEIQYQWGLLCDAVGLDEEAFEKYSQTLKIKPDHKESLYHLGIHYLKEGKVERAIRFLQKAAQLSPESPEVHMALGAALEKWALHGAAWKAFKRAKELDPSLEIVSKGPKETIRDKKEELPPMSFSEKDIDLFLRLFSGREGIYAKQWVDNTGKSGYYPVRNPLRKEDICAHFKGETTLGLYLMRSDNTVKVAVIDIDISKKTMETIQGKNSVFSPEWQSLARQDAGKIVDFLKNLDIPVYMEVSGWKGLHCWIFFEQPIRAFEVRNFLKEVIRKVDAPPPGLHREIFPKQDEVDKEGLGCLIKLPLGIHKLTHNRCLFVDFEGKPYENQIGLLWQIRPISLDCFKEAISRLHTAPREEEIIRPEIEISIQKVLEKCNVLRYLAKKAENEKDLSHFERLTLLHTLGHLGDPGRKAIHQIIRQCTNYRYDKTEKWLKRIQNLPVSCPRIREWLSDITPSVGCYCEFPVPEKGYPSPVLHADVEAIIKLKKLSESEKAQPEVEERRIAGEEKEKMEPGIPPSVKALEMAADLEELVKNFIGLKKERRKVEENLQEVESKLESLFQSRGVNSLQINIGNLTRIKKGEKTFWIIEL